MFLSGKQKHLLCAHLTKEKQSKTCCKLFFKLIAWNSCNNFYDQKTHRRLLLSFSLLKPSARFTKIALHASGGLDDGDWASGIYVANPFSASDQKVVPYGSGACALSLGHTIVTLFNVSHSINIHVFDHPKNLQKMFSRNFDHPLSPKFLLKKQNALTLFEKNGNDDAFAGCWRCCEPFWLRGCSKDCPSWARRDTRQKKKKNNGQTKNDVNMYNMFFCYYRKFKLFFWCLIFCIFVDNQNISESTIFW